MNKFKKIFLFLLVLLNACGAEQDVVEEQEQFGQVEQALGVSVTGTISYVNAWDPVYSGSQSYFRHQSYPGNTFPLTGVKYCLRRQDNGTEYCGSTAHTTAAYSIANVPQGNYWRRVYMVAGDNLFRVTDGDANGNNTVFTQAGQGISINQTNVVDNQTVGIGTWPSAGKAAANTYAAVRAWFDVLGTVHALRDIAEFNAMGVILVKDTTSTSAGTTDVKTQVFANPTNMVVWHELGHTLERNMHNQKFGTSGIWPAFAPYYLTNVANCNGPSGTTQYSSNTQLMEGFADFIQDVVEFDEFSGTSTCPAGGSACGVSNISTANPLTMPSCGAGSSLRSRSAVKQALIDLIDNQSPSPLGTCFTDATQLSVKQVVTAMRDTPFKQSQTGQTWGNSTIAVDETGLVDLLYTLQQQTGSPMYKIWANSCFQPGVAAGALTQ